MYSAQFWEEWYKSRKDTSTRVSVTTDHFHVVINPEKDGSMFNSTSFFRGENPEQVLQEVIAYFRDKGKSFTLTTRDSDQLILEDQLLRENGFGLLGVYNFMVADIINLVNLDTTSQLSIRKLGETDLLGEDHLSIINTCFPTYFPTIDAASAYMKQRISQVSRDEEVEVLDFGAFDGGRMVASASSSYLTTLPSTVQFSGASVLPEYRRQGIYRLFIGARARDAQERGKSHVFISADQSSSSPIVARLGFRSVMTMNDYMYELDHNQ
jgi:hypothetical protein